MYILQRRDSDKSQWHTCSQNGRKCRYNQLADARTAYRREKGSEDFKKHPARQLRIYDTDGDCEVE